MTPYINRKATGTTKIEKQVRGRFGIETLEVGVDAAAPVSRAYADNHLALLCSDAG